MEMTEIKGLAVKGDKTGNANILVRFTSDNIGETLILQHGDTMLSVPFENVEPIIIKARKKSRWKRK